VKTKIIRRARVVGRSANTLKIDVAEQNYFALNYRIEGANMFLTRTIKAYRGSGDVAALILNLCTTWK
jgi:hypothetical protein